MKFYGMVLAAVGELVIAVLLGLFVGKELDRYLGKESVFLITGAILGTSIGFYAMVSVLKKVMNNNDS